MLILCQLGCKYFLPIYHLPFTLFMVSFVLQKFLFRKQSKFLIFPFRGFCFQCHKKACAIPRSQLYSFAYSFNSLIFCFCFSFILTFNPSGIYFQKWHEVGTNFTIFLMDSWLSWCRELTFFDTSSSKMSKHFCISMFLDLA